MIIENIDELEYQILLRAFMDVRQSNPRTDPYMAGIKFGYALALVTRAPLRVQDKLSALLDNAADLAQREAFHGPARLAA